MHARLVPVALVAFALLATITAGAVAAELKVHTDIPGRFAIGLPENTGVKQMKKDMEHEVITVMVAELAKISGAVLVNYAPLPPKETANPKGCLLAAKEGGVPAGAELKLEQMGQFYGHPGIDLAFILNVDGMKLYIRNRIVLVVGRLYQIQIMGRNKPIPNELTLEILNSFKVATASQIQDPGSPEALAKALVAALQTQNEPAFLATVATVADIQRVASTIPEEFRAQALAEAPKQFASVREEFKESLAEGQRFAKKAGITWSDIEFVDANIHYSEDPGPPKADDMTIVVRDKKSKKVYCITVGDAAKFGVKWKFMNGIRHMIHPQMPDET